MTTPALAMEHLPLRTVEASFTTGRACAVCGETALTVIHVEELPDYVHCVSCESAFILSEAADWAMFGSVSSDYPETKHMVLKRWTTLEAVQTMASTERKAEGSNEGSGLGSDPTPPFGIGENGEPPEQASTPAKGIDGQTSTAEGSSTPPFGIGELDEFVAEQTNGSSVPGALPIGESADVSEPEPDRRYVVTLAGKAAVMPLERCAHCLRQPAPRMLRVDSSEASYEVPLCQSCHERASTGSEEQKTSNIVAHLSSILVAGLLIVGSLAVGVVDLSSPELTDLLLVATLTIVGYGVPVLILLRRSKRLPLSADALFVRSTLRLLSGEGLGFGWRNRGYAELFSTANAAFLSGELSPIADEPP